MKLNCDLGESYGAWTMTDDENIMPYVDMANIACGYHAGDPLVLKQVIGSAKQHNVAIGAHPSYPDLQGFGRRSMRLAEDELIAMVHYQVSALEGMAKCQDTELSYIKPHGALYNDMMANEAVFHTMLLASKAYWRSLPLVVQATPQWPIHTDEADKLGVSLMFEAFADRRYQDDGSLLPRSQPNSVLAVEEMCQQAEQLIKQGSVTTVSGKTLPVKADTLCVHGDNQAALDGIRMIRSFTEKS